VSASEEEKRRATRKIEVVRLGGSLLLPQESDSRHLGSLRARLNLWTEGRSGIRVWIVGTGAWGDHLRRMQAPLVLSDEASHWAAIGLMSVASDLAAELLDGSVTVRSFLELRRAIEGSNASKKDIVFDPATFLRDVEPTLPGPILPHDWSVTSDSIAARVAAAIDADAMTLLKACPPPERPDPQAWSEQGAVDAFFPRVACERKELRWVDLSGDEPVERRYPPS
jgi:5-(aminomethyl)-3-furanmethanol phosphate kinase